jgi:hypothetical protein
MKNNDNIKPISPANSSINNKKATSNICSFIPKFWTQKNKKEDNVKQAKKPIKSLNIQTNWVKGETINPYKETKKTDVDPPIVKLTKLSMKTDDKMYALSRLRERSTYNNIRLYLAFFYDKKDICLAGLTRTSLKVLIDQEGLPTNREELEKLYFEYHEKNGVPKDEVLKDLEICRSHMNNEYRDHLVRVRENWKKYMTP